MVLHLSLFFNIRFSLNEFLHLVHLKTACHKRLFLNLEMELTDDRLNVYILKQERHKNTSKYRFVHILLLYSKCLQDNSGGRVLYQLTRSSFQSL